jgi:hypothetical protein
MQSLFKFTELKQLQDYCATRGTCADGLPDSIQCPTDQFS